MICKTKRKAKFCWNCAIPKTVWWISKKKMKCEDNKTHLWVWFKDQVIEG